MIIRTWPRRAWVLIGLTATLWLVWQTRPGPDALESLSTSIDVRVEPIDGGWGFSPRKPTLGTGVVLYPGAMVDSRAFAGLAHRLAASGYPVRLLSLPYRGLGGLRADLFELTRAVLAANEPVGRWVLAGHSLGRKWAAEWVRAHPRSVAGLVLSGTGQPRDFSLYDWPGAVLKLYASEDGLATMDEVLARRDRLPESTRWVEIEGGNHAGFGDYGWQLGDGVARITQDRQQRLALHAILDFLSALEPGVNPGAGR